MSQAGDLATVSQISCWGDSMTERHPGVESFTDALAKLTGRTVHNFGISDQISTQVAARQGGHPAKFLVEWGRIPSEGGVVIAPLTFSPIMPKVELELTGTLSDVPGKLLYKGGVHWFERATPGPEKPLGEASVFMPSLALERRNDVQILWWGRRNYLETERILADFRLSCTFLGQHGRALIIGVVNSPGKTPGSMEHAAIVNLNDRLRDEYKDRFFDVRSYMIRSGLKDAGMSPSSGDIADIENDVPPRSLRFDVIHYNDIGNQLIARKLNEMINEQGW